MQVIKYTLVVITGLVSIASAGAPTLSLQTARQVKAEISKYEFNKFEITKQYVNHRPTVFAHIQRIILNSITDADIKKANLRDKIVSAGILYDKERLETGQSTQNIAYADALKARDQAKAIGNLLNEVWDQRQSEISQSATTAGLRAEDTKELCQLL